MSDNELIPLDALGGDMIVAQDAELLGDLSSGKGFLPYIQLFTLKSNAVAEGNIQGGHYGLVRDGNITDLGKEINICLLAVRARAFFKDGNNVTVIFDREDSEYKRIEGLQANKVQGAMTGPEVLCWLPAEETFATFFCGSPTLKKEARTWGKYLGKQPVTLKAKLCENAKGKWHGPVTVPFSGSLAPMPSAEEVGEELKKFKNPPKYTPGERVEQGNKEEVAR
jgi:hypothetical protein